MKEIVKIIAVYPTEQGTSQQTGNAWQKRLFVGETILSPYPKTIAFMTMKSDIVNTLDNVQVGMTLEVSFNIESREYNGKWYTDIRCYGLSAVDENVARQSQGQTATYQTPQVQQYATQPSPSYSRTQVSTQQTQQSNPNGMGSSAPSTYQQPQQGQRQMFQTGQTQTQITPKPNDMPF